MSYFLIKCICPGFCHQGKYERVTGNWQVKLYRYSINTTQLLHSLCLLVLFSKIPTVITPTPLTCFPFLIFCWKDLLVDIGVTSSSVNFCHYRRIIQSLYDRKNHQWQSRNLGLSIFFFLCSTFSSSFFCFFIFS